MVAAVSGELLDCPFCGGNRLELVMDAEAQMVECLYCHAQGPSELHEFTTAQQARERWSNRRAAQPSAEGGAEGFEEWWADEHSDYRVMARDERDKGIAKCAWQACVAAGARERQGWVSVEERLPEELEERHHVWVRFASALTLPFVAEFFDGSFWVFNVESGRNEIARPIRYWMAIEPPPARHRRKTTVRRLNS